ncbi:MAG TPA: NYN domain-containing protein [Methylomirabilota bacterium]|nr:NYN domain-containing protein [Methylomirabilota bacterium]
MESRLIIVDGYNIILRSPRLKPGDGRTLRDSRDKLINLLAWMMGGNDARFVVVFDGAEMPGRDESSGRVQVMYSRPPEKADDVIRRLVEKKVGGDEHITVVTADIEVARHARAMGADVSLADLFLASALGAGAQGGEGGDAVDAEKPTSLSKQELKEWAEIFTRRAKAAGDAAEEPDN